MSAILRERARVAALTRSRTPDDPALVEARRTLAAENLAAYIERVVAEAPPLTSAQRDRIAALLRPIPGGAPPGSAGVLTSPGAPEGSSDRGRAA